MGGEDNGLGRVCAGQLTRYAFHRAIDGNAVVNRVFQPRPLKAVVVAGVPLPIRIGQQAHRFAIVADILSGLGIAPGTGVPVWNVCQVGDNPLQGQFPHIDANLRVLRHIGLIVNPGVKPLIGDKAAYRRDKHNQRKNYEYPFVFFFI